LYSSYLDKKDISRHVLTGSLPFRCCMSIVMTFLISHPKKLSVSLNLDSYFQEMF